MIFASQIQAMHSADWHLRMCGPFFKTTVLKSRRRWLLKQIVVYTWAPWILCSLSFLYVLFQHLLAGDFAGSIRRLSAETTAMANQAPQAALNGVANRRRKVVWYCGGQRSRVLPSLRNSGRNSGFRRIPEQINLALEWFNSDVCSAEFCGFHEKKRIPENEAWQELE